MPDCKSLERHGDAGCRVYVAGGLFGLGLYFEP